MDDLLESELIDAVKSGNLPLARALVEDIDPTEALIKAAEYGNIPIAKMLVEEIGADPLDADVHNAANENENFDIIDYLVGRGADFISSDGFGCYDAFFLGLPNIIKYCYDNSFQNNTDKKNIYLQCLCMQLS